MGSIQGYGHRADRVRVPTSKISGKILQNKAIGFELPALVFRYTVPTSEISHRVPVLGDMVLQS